MYPHGRARGKDGSSIDSPKFGFEGPERCVEFSADVASRRFRFCDVAAISLSVVLRQLKYILYTAGCRLVATADSVVCFIVRQLLYRLPLCTVLVPVSDKRSLKCAPKHQ
jgi:hypothetical protein